MSVSWTKSYSASDDGTAFGGGDLGDIQSDIVSYLVHLSGDQTVTGDKTFSGDNAFSGKATFSGALVGVVGVDEFISYEGDGVFHDGDMVYYK